MAKTNQSKALQTTQSAINPVALETVLAGGDVSKLEPAQKVSFLIELCKSLKLNHLTQPFGFFRLNGKEVLYAKKDCTDQLRKVHQVSIEIVSRTQVGNLLIVTARATLPSGRKDESIGAVSIAGLTGDALANAMMKAETKAKRRVTLSICGLGITDESELETIAGARDVTPDLKPPTSSEGAAETTVQNPPPAPAKTAAPPEDPLPPMPPPQSEELPDLEANFDEIPEMQSDEEIVQELGGYRIRFEGNFKGKTLKEIPPGNLDKYLDWLEKQTPEQVGDSGNELLWHGDQYLAALRRIRDRQAQEKLKTTPNVASDLINKHKGKN